MHSQHQHSAASQPQTACPRSPARLDMASSIPIWKTGVSTNCKPKKNHQCYKKEMNRSKKHITCRLSKSQFQKMSHMTAGRRKTPMGLLRSTHQNRRKTQKAFTPKERQRLQRMKADAFRQLDKQIRREQMAIVQRIRYLESIPAHDHFAQDRMAVDQDEDESDDEIFQDLLEDICAIDIGGDDYAEILEFEVQADTSGVWEETIAGLGDLF